MPVPKKVLWAGETGGGELRQDLGEGRFETTSSPQKRCLLSSSENWMTNFELLKTSLKKVVRQTEVMPIQKESSGQAKPETENFGRTSVMVD